MCKRNFWMSLERSRFYIVYKLHLKHSLASSSRYFYYLSIFSFLFVECMFRWLRRRQQQRRRRRRQRRRRLVFMSISLFAFLLKNSSHWCISGQPNVLENSLNESIIISRTCWTRTSLRINSNRFEHVKFQEFLSQWSARHILCM